MLRSVLAVAAGLVTTTLLGIAGMAILLVATYGIPMGSSPGVPGWPFLVANLAVTALAGVAGGWVAGSIGRRRPLVHAVALALAITALAALSVRPRPLEPVWFAVTSRPPMAMRPASTASRPAINRRSSICRSRRGRGGRAACPRQPRS